MRAREPRRAINHRLEPLDRVATDGATVRADPEDYGPRSKLGASVLRAARASRASSLQSGRPRRERAAPSRVGMTSRALIAVVLVSNSAGSRGPRSPSPQAAAPLAKTTDRVTLPVTFHRGGRRSQRQQRRPARRVSRAGTSAHVDALPWRTPAEQPGDDGTLFPMRPRTDRRGSGHRSETGAMG
jgi:hypothetical protein